MGSVIQLVAVVVAVVFFASLWFAKRRRYHSQKQQQVRVPANVTVFDQLSFDQLKVMTSVPHPRFIRVDKTTMKDLFNVEDVTEVDGVVGLTRVPQVPRGTRRAAMFDGRRIVICLSEDKKTLLHQESDSDDGRVWMYLVCSQDRTLEEAFELLVERARKKTAETSSQRRAR